MMSNQTPDDFNNAAPAPDFSPLLPQQPDQFQSPASPAQANFTPGEKPSPSAQAFQAAPATGSADSLTDEANLSRWAEQRQAAYASLDAALERHISEAIRTITELKRQAEAEAARASYSFVVNRDNLRQEITDLKQEQARLQAQLEESRRTIQEEAARQAEARTVREELEREVNRLRGQLGEIRRPGQTAQLEGQESGGRVGFFGQEKSFPGETAALSQEFSAPSVLQQEPAVAASPTPAPVMEIASEVEVAPEPATVPEAAQAAPPTEFGEVVTPKIPGGSPVVILEPALRPQTTLSDLGILEPEIMPARSGPIHAITPSTFAYLQELLMSEPPDLPLADVAQPSPIQEDALPLLAENNRTATTGQLRLGSPGNLEQTAGLPPRRGQTDQLGGRLPKRRHTTGGLGPLPGQAAETVTPAPAQAVEAVSPAPATVPEEMPATPVETRPRRSQSLSETEKQQKVVLRELGLQLGLTDPMTPPSLTSMSFAAGYTPPYSALSLSDMLDEINASVSAILPPLAAVAPVANGGKAAKKVVEPPPPISPDTNLDDYSIEVEPPSPTLQELLEAGEQELAAINEDPTPPENPTPFIGKIGADHPVHFQPSPTITPRPEPLSMLNQEMDTAGPATPSVKPPAPGAPSIAPPRAFRPLNIRPGRSREPQEINLPLSLTFPPLTNAANTRQTYVTITNLQGRYTLPMLEKILRELVGVAELVVSEFNQETLLMEVIHRPNLNLATQLTTLADLPLNLVNETPDTLVFVKDRQ